MDTRVAAGGTPIRRYALALTPTGAGIEAAVTAASVPPLSGGPGNHGSEAAHAFTIADSVGGTGSQPAEGRCLCSGSVGATGWGEDPGDLGDGLGAWAGVAHGGTQEQWSTGADGAVGEAQQPG